MAGNNEYPASVTRGREDSVPCRALVYLDCQAQLPLEGSKSITHKISWFVYADKKVGKEESISLLQDCIYPNALELRLAR